MKGPIPTTAEHINIAGTEEPLNNSVIQLQISEAFHDDVKASVPVVHEITTGDPRILRVLHGSRPKARQPAVPQKELH